MHHVFHAKHNRQVDQIKATLLADATVTSSTTFLNQWLTTSVAAVPANPATLVWDGERLFQAAKFATEMQYSTSYSKSSHAPCNRMSPPSWPLTSSIPR